MRARDLPMKMEKSQQLILQGAMKAECNRKERDREREWESHVITVLWWDPLVGSLKQKNDAILDLKEAKEIRPQDIWYYIHCQY